MPAERKELAGEGRRTLSRLYDLFHMLVQLILLSKTVYHQLAISVDDGQQIVEVVRNPSGQAPDGFHLLRLAKLLFKFLAFCHVLLPFPTRTAKVATQSAHG